VRYCWYFPAVLLRRAFLLPNPLRLAHGLLLGRLRIQFVRCHLPQDDAAFPDRLLAIEHPDVTDRHPLLAAKQLVGDVPRRRPGMQHPDAKTAHGPISGGNGGLPARTFATNCLISFGVTFIALLRFPDSPWKRITGYWPPPALDRDQQVARKQ
jgi:hypothetical protein